MLVAIDSTSHEMKILKRNWKKYSIARSNEILGREGVGNRELLSCFKA
jgi:hypothetical protein